MRAIILESYGGPDVLKVFEISKPTINDHQVLVQVRACAANAADWHVMRGDPYLARLYFGLNKPKKNTVLGNDFAGIVEAVGPQVNNFRPGDEVFGQVVTGAFADFVCVSENSISHKPHNLSFEQAASVPCAGLTALQALRNAGNIQPEQKVLITGASGGVGSFAVQIAKALGAEVTAVCSTGNVEIMQSIGANYVIDYTREDYTLRDHLYDLILDIAGDKPFADIRRVLKPTGTFCPVGGPGGGLLGSMADSLKAFVVSQLLSQKVALLITNVNKTDLDYLKELIETDKVVPLIDSQYTFYQIPKAIRHVEKGHPLGKVVISISPE
ncbi:putative zinc-binding oxidoreductase [Umbelopsis sp. PMI_123]|nr:putative zinc-binding oxidoreductase [Umbelopsis sp. PMI_123]